MTIDIKMIKIFYGLFGNGKRNYITPADKPVLQ